MLNPEKIIVENPHKITAVPHIPRRSINVSLTIDAVHAAVAGVILGACLFHDLFENPVDYQELQRGSERCCFKRCYLAINKSLDFGYNSVHNNLVNFG